MGLIYCGLYISSERVNKHVHKLHTGTRKRSEGQGDGETYDLINSCLYDISIAPR